MKACGVIVEYNPFHNGHAYHIEQSKKVSGADCMVAVMSSSFLQRGEPALVDKFHRTKAALASGIDIVLELPYAYSVQSSKYFAEGSVLTLHELGVESLCFGSESGELSDFLTSYDQLQDSQPLYTAFLKQSLNKGYSYPSASSQAYQNTGIISNGMDLSKPNNILGFAYIQAILDHALPIRPLTIQRIKSDYHDDKIDHTIASATSIRKNIMKEDSLSDKASAAMTQPMQQLLMDYRETTGLWHAWELYFPFLHYKIMTLTLKELASIQGVDEGLEHRIKKTAKTVTSFKEWMEAIKTKRYTWTRLQRMFIHILTGTTKESLKSLLDPQIQVPYVRMLGMNQTGQAYLNEHKQAMRVPFITRLSDLDHEMLAIEERATRVYYSILAPNINQRLFRQELGAPVRITRHSGSY